MPPVGWHSVTTPGAVSAWTALSRRFGALPFARLFQRAVALAESGFLVTPAVATLWAMGARQLERQPGFADTFLPGGRAPRTGERFRNPDLAATLQRIAETGGEAFTGANWPGASPPRRAGTARRSPRPTWTPTGRRGCARCRCPTAG